ncbi:hypothetical protein FOZ76_14540 [Verticiella sediminum]|uniref:Uncharacterized protein n=1 Tax=Verticiella sediminum TaxID=1247510 RepID=A0A556AIF1_9BURK|nr:hypothetical protein [Verticiella sediminum]TSH92635.1 hypothetical protein FOZ76_14540 [Verticiella sediminum]
MIKFRSTLGEGSKFLDATSRQVPFATAVALNTTGQRMLEALKSEIDRRIDRPTPYTRNALRLSRARKDKLEATVDFKDAAGKGTSAGRYLSPQALGGGRSRKRSELAFARRSGIPTGSYLVPGAAAELDPYGNVSRGQVVRLLSYLQAFGEEGYRANATDKRRKRLAKVGTTEQGFRRINGVVYFVSRGRGTLSGNREQHLPAGIWSKTGIHGGEVSPVFLAVDEPRYQPRLPFYERADEVYAAHFETDYQSALNMALATAR